jgi:hypothetical protein
MFPNGLEVKAFKINIVVIIANFIYDYIIMHFGCFMTFVTYQGLHFINNDIQYLIEQLLMHHINFTMYYHQGNG